jgi:hypothetical protein
VHVSFQGQSDMLEGGLEVVAALPTITHLSKTKGARGNEFDLSIYGTGFQSQATSNFGEGIEVSPREGSSAEELKVHVKIASNAKLGLRTVSVQNPNQLPVMRLDSFEVLQAEVPAEPLTVKKVELFGPDNNTPSDSLDMNDVDKPIQVADTENIQIIRVTFSDPVKLESVIPATSDDDLAIASFLVEADSEGIDTGYVPGTVRIDPQDPKVVLFEIDAKCFASGLPAGTYHVTLYGQKDSDDREVITDQEGEALDGDMDDTAGGDFDFTIVVASAMKVR